jgi:AcrR family transcriptional regulator
MTQLDLAPTVPDESTRPGRKRDHTRDPEILEAALEVLAETGYDRMTVDMVAARAKAGKATLYRRWPGKAELITDAVGCLHSGPALTELPDTGTLRGDLVAMVSQRTVADGERKLQILLGLASVLVRSPGLADSIRASFLEPRAAVTEALLRRAAERGEIRSDVDFRLLSKVSSSMVISRALLDHKAIDRAFLLSVIDEVVLPAVGLRSAG